MVDQGALIYGNSNYERGLCFMIDRLIDLSDAIVQCMVFDLGDVDVKVLIWYWVVCDDASAGVHSNLLRSKAGVLFHSFHFHQIASFHQITSLEQPLPMPFIIRNFLAFLPTESAITS